MSQQTKRVIPQVPKSAIGTDRQPFDMAIKEDLEILMGQRTGLIAPLPSTATTTDLISKVNEIIQRLQ